MRRVVIASVATIATVAVLHAAVAAPVNTVAVHSNFFDPHTITIEPGDSVRWAWHSGPHTVTSSARTGAEVFDSGSLSQGATFEHRYTTEGVWTYFCELHGGDGYGMWGRVIVDDGVGDGPGNQSEEHEHRRMVRVPEDVATLKEAAGQAAEGAVISVAPGTYIGSVAIRTPGVTIRGRGKRPGEVVITGHDGERTVGTVGVDVGANDVVIENITVAAFPKAGVRATGVERLKIVDVALSGNRAAGVVIDAAQQVTVRRATVSDSLVGIRVYGCIDCDSVIDSVLVAGTGIGDGIRIVDAGGVVVSRSATTGWETGIVVAANDVATESGGLLLWQNQVAAAKGGIDITGGRHTRVEANEVVGGSYAIRVAGVPIPSYDVRITDNHVRSPGSALVWDGVGADVCFSGNASMNDGTRGEPSSVPPLLQTLSPC